MFLTNAGFWSITYNHLIQLTDLTRWQLKPGLGYSLNAPLWQPLYIVYLYKSGK